MRSYKSEITYRIPLSVQFYIRYGQFEYPLCPRCSNSLDREQMAFCDRCGQKLTWKKYIEERRISPNH